MLEPDDSTERVGLADYLTELGAELEEAGRRAEGSPLRLAVQEVTVTLEVAVTKARQGSGAGKLSAKFWVLNAEAGGGVERSSQRVGMQHVTLKLKPRVESVIVDDQGHGQVTSRELDVSSEVTGAEESPEFPRLPTST